jgi:receptor protein-tyrosine kinase
MRTLGLQPRRGLLDVLTNPQLDFSEVLLRTNIPKLSLLPAGTCSVHSTELLASDAMDRLLGELASRYSDRVVIFDTTPLLLTSEAKVLASRMGQVVVVVEESGTPYQALQEAFAAVDHCPVVMSILNKDRKSGPDYGSYYG